MTPSIALVRERFTYNPETGALHWRAAADGSGRRYAGRLAGSKSAGGYTQVSLSGSVFTAHRIIWALVTGEWPSDQIDHINGDGRDNRWANLRNVGASVNQQNLRGAKRSSTTGLLGVRRQGAKFAAQIKTHGRYRHLGTFSSAEAAYAAYLAAKRAMHEGNTL